MKNFTNIFHFPNEFREEDYLDWIPISLAELENLRSSLVVIRVKCIVSPEEILEFDLNSDFPIPQHLLSPDVQWYRWGFTD